MITIENTSYGYKSNPLIFNNISLEIGNGIYGLLGENGVGKTTLMHLICGLLFPKNGKCSIDGRNTAERQSEGLARYFFLPEELQMPTESIASFAARHSVFYPHFNQEEFKLNLEELKINRKQKLSSVSYGQQKKAMLAYAFALHTPYILLDEPTNGLDITVTIMQDGRIHPTVATTAPGIPAIFSPTKVAEFTAMGPGVICDIVIRSVNSDMVSHP